MGYVTTPKLLSHVALLITKCAAGLTAWGKNFGTLFYENFVILASDVIYKSKDFGEIMFFGSLKN